MLPKARLTHRGCERLRFYLPEKKRDTKFFKKLHADLKDVEGIEEIRINPVSASVLLLGSLDSKDLLNSIEDSAKIKFYRRSEFRLTAKKSSFLGLAKSFRSGTVEWDTAIRQKSNDDINLRDLAALSLIGLSLFQLARGQRFLPVGGTLFIQGLQLLSKNKST